MCSDPKTDSHKRIKMVTVKYMSSLGLRQLLSEIDGTKINHKHKKYERNWFDDHRLNFEMFGNVNLVFIVVGRRSSSIFKQHKNAKQKVIKNQFRQQPNKTDRRRIMRHQPPYQQQEQQQQQYYPTINSVSII